MARGGGSGKPAASAASAPRPQKAEATRPDKGGESAVLLKEVATLQRALATVRQEMAELATAHQGLLRQVQGGGMGPAPALPVRQPPPAPPRVVFSGQHDAIFASMLGDAPGPIVLATAGSGKTTTLVEGCRRLRAANRKANITFLAFNRSVAETLKGKLGTAAKASTINALCWRAAAVAHEWTTTQATSIVNPGRVWSHANAVIKGAGHAGAPDVLPELVRLWNLAISTLTNMRSVDDLRAMVAIYGAEVEDRSVAFDLVDALDQRLRDDPSSITHDEILRDVAEGRVPVDPVDILLIDEVQDLNRLQIEVIARLGAKKVIAVGDPRQAIYAFRGSDHHAIDTLAERFSISTRLPLSVSYRCAKNIVREANALVPEIEAAPQAPEGEVLEREPDDLRATLADLQPGDLVISRINAPLLGSALELYRAGRPVCILGGSNGRDAVQAELRSGSERHREENPVRLGAILREELTRRALALESSGLTDAAATVRDQAATAQAVLGACGSVVEACALLSQMSQPQPMSGAITFSTIHRAKGHEANRVVILGSNLIPHRRVLETNSMTLAEQEWNLRYVAITRARTALVKQEVVEEY